MIEETGQVGLCHVGHEDRSTGLEVTLLKLSLLVEESRRNGRCED